MFINNKKRGKRNEINIIFAKAEEKQEDILKCKSRAGHRPKFESPYGHFPKKGK